MTDDEVDRRLRGWAMWRNGAGVGSGGEVSSIYSGEERSGYRESSPPRIDGEAIDVDGVIGKMRGENREVLELVYCWGLRQDVAARRAHCSVATIERRLHSARSQVKEGLWWLAHRVQEGMVN